MDLPLLNANNFNLTNLLFIVNNVIVACSHHVLKQWTMLWFESITTTIIENQNNLLNEHITMWVKILSDKRENHVLGLIENREKQSDIVGGAAAAGGGPVRRTGTHSGQWRQVIVATTIWMSHGFRVGRFGSRICLVMIFFILSLL